MKSIVERKDQIRCQRQAYEALEQQLRLSTKQEHNRIAELADELRSEKNASKSGHLVKHFGEVLERKLGRVEEELDREKASVRELRSTMEDRERVAAVEAKERSREVEELKRELDKSKEDSHKHKKALRMVELEVTKDIERLVAEH
ncbi:hypothetical protein FOZ63_003026, partial [Perkinsus olseni]